MTEAEAKTKWCPFARAAIVALDPGTAGNSVTVNRVAEGWPDADCMCIASACMAWHWHLESHGKSGYCRLMTR